jgi:hypothetical protein
MDTNISKSRESVNFQGLTPISHQYIEHIDEEIRSAIFGNFGTLITFGVGAKDAQFLKNEFSPTFDETDFVSITNYHIYLKLMINGVTSRPFKCHYSSSSGSKNFA